MKPAALATALLLGAAPALQALPAHAYPQWLSLTPTLAIDYNSISSHGNGTRSAVVTLDGYGAGRETINCPRWLRLSMATGMWDHIGRESNAEAVAYALCPGSMQSAAIKRAYARTYPAAAPEPAPAAAPTQDPAERYQQAVADQTERLRLLMGGVPR